MKEKLVLAAIAWTLVAAPAAWAQSRIEITPFAGGQLNGGVDLSTALYNRLDVKSGVNYGVIASYSINNRLSAEFMWNRNQGDTFAQPISAGPDVKVFSLKTNQYLGDLLLHVNSHESRLRPFVLFGAGVSNLAPDRSNVNSITRFTWVFGGGVKYTLSKHVGLRFQAKWSPIYINTATVGVWCDPFWAGCWEKGDSVFLQEFDGTAGLTFRF